MEQTNAKLEEMVCQLMRKPHDSRNLGLHDRSGAVFVLPRTELCEAKAGRDSQ